MQTKRFENPKSRAAVCLRIKEEERTRREVGECVRGKQQRRKKKENLEREK